jgi:hypothetical protein
MIRMPAPNAQVRRIQVSMAHGDGKNLECLAIPHAVEFSRFTAPKKAGRPVLGRAAHRPRRRHDSPSLRSIPGLPSRYQKHQQARRRIERIDPNRVGIAPQNGLLRLGQPPEY